MIYCQTVNKECIAVRPLNDINNTQCVELIKYGSVPMFAVYVYDGKDKWTWEFEQLNPSDYERVKISVFDAIFACDTMPELAVALDSIFKDECENILIEDECDECDGCEGCNKHRR